MSWIFIAVLSHSLSGLAFLTDKFLVSKRSLAPIAYAFYVSILGLSVLVLIPFGFSIPGSDLILFSLLVGASFLIGNFFFYKSLELGEVSRMAPLIGGFVPVFAFILSYIFLNNRLSLDQIIAFIVLIIGGMVIIWPSRKKISNLEKLNLNKKLIIALVSAFFFGASFVATKFIFNELSFINGLIWTRLATAFSALLLLFLPFIRRKIFQESKEMKFSTSGILVANKSLSAIGFILFNYAIFLGPVALVNALQGVQYVFLLVFAVILSKKLPSFIKEQVNPSTILQKVLGIFLIVFGLFLLVF